MYAQKQEKAVSVPLINAGSHNPDSAVELIESGNVDFVNMGRALIADPYLPNKLMTGHPRRCQTLPSLQRILYRAHLE